MATYNSPRVNLPIFNPLVYPTEEASPLDRNRLLSYTFTSNPVVGVTGTGEWQNICCSADGTIIYAIEGSISNLLILGYIWVSTDGGTTWTQRTLFGNQYCFVGCCCSADGTRAVIGEISGGTRYVFVTTDTGTTWTRYSNVNTRWSNFDCNTSGLIVYGASALDYVYKSTDGGINWSALTGTGALKFRAVACSSNGDIVYAGVGVGTGTTPTGYIYKSTNGGTTWTALTNSLDQMYYSLSCSSNGQIVIAGSSQYVQVSIDGGDSWTTQTSLPNGEYFGVRSSIDGTKLFAVHSSTGNLYYSEDYGVNWTTQYLNPRMRGVDCNTDGTLVYANNFYQSGVTFGYVWKGLGTYVSTSS